MLTVFIIPSHAENADAEKTINSFTGIAGGFEAVPVSGFEEVNSYKDKGEWFGIFWDNESIDENLKEYLPVFLHRQNFEYLILYKKEKKAEATWRARLFRKHIYLVDDFAPTSFWYNKEIVLDGWVLDHGRRFPNTR